MSLLVRIGDVIVSSVMGEELKTMALGSCVALVAIDVARHVSGMVHVALPDSSVDPRKAVSTPGFFADTGVSMLIDMMKSQGGSPQPKFMTYKLIGGAKVIKASGGNQFDIGKRNAIAIKKAMWKLGIAPSKMILGGEVARSVYMTVGSLDVAVRRPGQPEEMI